MDVETPESNQDVLLPEQDDKPRKPEPPMGVVVHRRTIEVDDGSSKQLVPMEDQEQTICDESILQD